MIGSLRRLIEFVDPRAGAIALGLAGLILVAGIVYANMLDDRLPYIDEQDYHAIATNVVTKHFFSNDGIRPNGSRAPLYPLLLAGLIALGADVAELRLINITALAMSVYLLYRMVRHIASPLAGVLAAALVVGYPVMFYIAGTLFPQALGGFLFVLALWLLSRSQTTDTLVITGVVFGLLMLTIPMFIFTLMVVAAWLFVVEREARIRSLVALVAPAMAVVAVWSVRNYLVFKAFVPLTTSMGAALLWGNSPQSTIGGADMDFLVRAFQESASMNEAEANTHNFQLALRAISENKLWVLGFYFLKVLNYFSFVNQHYAVSETSVAKTVLMAMTYCPLLALFALRLGWWRRFRPSAFEILLIGIYVSSAFFYAIFHTRIRYRLPYDFILIAVVAMFVTGWLASRHPAWFRAKEPAREPVREAGAAGARSSSHTAR